MGSVGSFSADVVGPVADATLAGRQVFLQIPSRPENQKFSRDAMPGKSGFLCKFESAFSAVS